jgi:hypothetical protein
MSGVDSLGFYLIDMYVYMASRCNAFSSIFLSFFAALAAESALFDLSLWNRLFSELVVDVERMEAAYDFSDEDIVSCKSITDQLIITP